MKLELEHFRNGKDFGRLLRSCRAQRGLTQAALGKLVGSTQPGVARWESGVCSPRMTTVFRLGEVLGWKVVFSLNK